MAENSFLAHLEALRKALLGMAAVTALLFPAAYWAAPHLLAVIVRWSCPEGMVLHYFSPLEVFMVQVKFAIFLALAAGFPFNARFGWRFLLPALHENEKKAFSRWLISSALLFALGGFFALRLMMPLVMGFSMSFASAGVQPLYGMANFAELAGALTLACGLVFQTPVAVLLAVKCGLISADTLVEKRPYAVVVILIFAAIFTPPDVVSQVLLALPAYLLFEAGIFFARNLQKNSSAD